MDCGVGWMTSSTRAPSAICVNSSATAARVKASVCMVEYPSRSVHIAHNLTFSDDAATQYSTRGAAPDQALERAGVEMKSSRNGDGGTAMAGPMSDPDPDIRIPAPYAPLLL